MITIRFGFRLDDLDEVLPLAVFLADAVGDHKVVIAGHESVCSDRSPHTVTFLVHGSFGVNPCPGLRVVG